MPVVINEFEVIVDEGRQERGAQPPPQPGPAPGGAPALSPRELQDVIRHQVERMARLAAH